MKKIKNILYLPMALMMLLMLSLSSCGNLFDEYDEYDETGTLILSLKNGATVTRANGLFQDDDFVERIRVIVFDGSGVEYNHLFDSSLSDLDNPIRVVLTTGIKSVYVVANEDQTLSSGLQAVTTAAGLEQMMANDIAASIDPTVEPLLMVGKVNNLNLVTGVNNSIVSLKRAAAKINIQLKKGTSVPVTISEIKVLNNTGKTSMWEGGPILDSQSQTWWHHSASYSQALTNTNWSALTLYVYENLGNVAPNNLSNATQLEIKGTYNGLPATYKAYVNYDVTASNPNPGDPNISDTDPKDHFYNIKRNHVYNVTGTISGLGEFDGITIYTEVDDEWTPVYKNFFVGYGYTVDVDGTTVTVSNHDEDCLPHEVLLVPLQGLTLEGQPTQSFTNTAANASASYALSGTPGLGDYLEVYYNGVLVNTFTK